MTMRSPKRQISKGHVRRVIIIVYFLFCFFPPYPDVCEKNRHPSLLFHWKLTNLPAENTAASALSGIYTRSAIILRVRSLAEWLSGKHRRPDRSEYNNKHGHFVRENTTTLKIAYVSYDNNNNIIIHNLYYGHGNIIYRRCRGVFLLSFLSPCGKRWRGRPEILHALYTIEIFYRFVQKIASSLMVFHVETITLKIPMTYSLVRMNKKRCVVVYVYNTNTCVRNYVPFRSVNVFFSFFFSLLPSQWCALSRWIHSKLIWIQ